MPNAKTCVPYSCWQYLFVLCAFITVTEAFFLTKTTLDSNDYIIAILKNKKKDSRNELMRELEEEKRKFFLTSTVSTTVYLRKETIKYRFVTDLDTENSSDNNITNVNHFTPATDNEVKSTVLKTDVAVENDTATIDSHINNYSTINNREKSATSKMINVEENDTGTTGTHINNYFTTKNEQEQSAASKTDNLAGYQTNVGPTSETQTINNVSGTDTDKYPEHYTSTTIKAYKYVMSAGVKKYTTEVRSLSKFTEMTDDKVLNSTWNNNKDVTKHNIKTNPTTPLRHVNDVRKTTPAVLNMTTNILITDREIQNATCSLVTNNTSFVPKVTKNSTLAVDNKVTTCFFKLVNTTIVKQTTESVWPKKKKKHHHRRIHKLKKTNEGFDPSRKALRFNAQNKMCLETKICLPPTKMKYKEVPNHVSKMNKRPVLSTDCHCGILGASYEVANHTTPLNAESEEGMLPNNKNNQISRKSIKRKKSKVVVDVKKNPTLRNQHEMSTSAKKIPVTEKTIQKYFRVVQGTKTTRRILFNTNCTCCKNSLIQMKKDNMIKVKKLLKESSNRILHNTLTTKSLSLTQKNESKSLISSKKETSTRGQKTESNNQILDSQNNREYKNGIRIGAGLAADSSTTSEVDVYGEDDYYDDYYEEYDKNYTSNSGLRNENDYFRKRAKHSTQFTYSVTRRKSNFEEVTLPTNLELIGQKILNIAKGLGNEIRKKESVLRKIRKKELFVKEWLGYLNQIRNRCELYVKGLNKVRKRHINRLWELLHLTMIKVHIEERINGRLNKILQAVKKKI